MGLLSGILGNASKVDTAELQEELEPLLIDGEDVVTAFKVVRDLVTISKPSPHRMAAFETVSQLRRRGE